MNANLSWVSFFTELATKLLEYEHDRASFMQKVRSVDSSVGKKLNKMDSTNISDEIDPFSFLGQINKGISTENRIRTLQSIKTEFAIKSDVPSTFDGIPVLNNLSATFFAYSGRPDQRKLDIDILWDVFVSAVRFADNPTSSNRVLIVKAYNSAKSIKGNRWKLSLGLFWIRPNTYLNLDSRNRWFLSNPDHMPKSLAARIKAMSNLPSGSEYLDLCEAVINALRTSTYPYKNLPELSYEAWKVSEEVNEARREEEVPNLGSNSPMKTMESGVEITQYWIYSPGDGASKWNEFYQEGIMAIGWGDIGDLTPFSTKDDMKSIMKDRYGSEYTYKNAAHATWQFAKEMKQGDIVFVKKGMYQIVGKGIVESAYRFNPDRGDDYKHTRQMRWTHNGSWPHPGQAVMKTLTNITPYTDYVDKLNRLFVAEEVIQPEEKEVLYPPYTAENFLNEVYLNQGEYDTLVSLLQNKKNVILQGAPGVGKTFLAKRLAYAIMGVKDTSRVAMIQFHQSYSYEDFIMGFRPITEGFELKKGVFYNFCKAAEIDNENDYFFIIDEINRGNLSKIFGELMMLIENDKRGIEIQLLYSDEKFSVPDNVYIIGMMNTADRSLALLDYALRRRFAFYNLKPAFRSEGFQNYRQTLNNSKFDRLIATVESLNQTITSDDSLGEGFCIGHSYFCNLIEANQANLSRIVEFELIPLLKEYWFDEHNKVADWSARLRGSIS